MKSAPVWFIPDFVSAAEADSLFDRLRQTVPWEQQEISLFGRRQPVPRLTCWFGSAAYEYSGITNVAHRWTPDLIDLRRAVEGAAGARFNSCLANYYRNGRDSVGWHSDDEAELGPRPIIASVSLGAVRRFRLRHRRSGTVRDLDLLSGSLLVMWGDCQAEWQHCVPKRLGLAEARINLTFRSFETSATKQPLRRELLPPSTTHSRQEEPR